MKYSNFYLFRFPIFQAGGTCVDVTESSGFIRSLNSFNDNSVITYTLRATTGKRITLVFTKFNIKPKCDFISVSNIHKFFP